MAGVGERRVLLAVDGSEQAFEAVRYVSEALAPGSARIVLFNVLTRVPESFWDLEKEPAYQYRIINITEWEAQTERMIRDFMKKSRDILLAAGFAEEAVIEKVQDRKAGVARDIIDEVQTGYDLVVVGRRGLSEFKDLVMGNIADKLVQKIAELPVWVVGGKVQPRRMLVCMDSSAGAMRAVEVAAHIVNGGSPFEVRIFNAVRSLNIFKQVFDMVRNTEPGSDWGAREKEEMDGAERDVLPVLEKARQVFIAAGMDPERVDLKVVKGVSSRASAIIEEAEAGAYDTIVVGRRGLSMMEEFFMGRVSSKVIQMARERTVWVIH